MGRPSRCAGPKEALDRDGRLGWRIVPTVAEVQQIRAVDRPT